MSIRLFGTEGAIVGKKKMELGTGVGLGTGYSLVAHSGTASRSQERLSWGPTCNPGTGCLGKKVAPACPVGSLHLPCRLGQEG